MQQPEGGELVRLALTKVEIRPTSDFMDELWAAMHEAVFKTGEAIFVCHVRHNTKLALDSRRASTIMESFHNDCMFGFPVKYTRESQSLFHLIKQSGIDLNEPVIVTGEITSRWVEACERHPNARQFYAHNGPMFVPGNKVVEPTE